VRSDRERLLDIIEAVENVERYARRGRDEFARDELVQTWVVHHIQIIGEAAGRLSDELRTGHPDVNWTAIIAMRNVLVHDYFGIDVEEVWATVEHDLPRLRRQIAAVLSSLPRE
jgi:uncharacterized protein with HEPN domain